MKLKVLRYDYQSSFYRCEDEKGKLHWVDLFIDASLKGKKYRLNPDLLMGRVVSVSYLHPYQEIAHDVELLKII